MHSSEGSRLRARRAKAGRPGTRVPGRSADRAARAAATSVEARDVLLSPAERHCSRRHPRFYQHSSRVSIPGNCPSTRSPHAIRLSETRDKGREIDSVGVDDDRVSVDTACSVNTDVSLETSAFGACAGVGAGMSHAKHSKEDEDFLMSLHWCSSARAAGSALGRMRIWYACGKADRRCGSHQI